jgi:hypothetical protein
MRRGSSSSRSSDRRDDESAIGRRTRGHLGQVGLDVFGVCEHHRREFLFDATIEVVPTRPRRVLGAILLAVCIGAPVAEMFDRWDRTAQDGNDTESNLVVVAVCIGVGMVAAAAMLRRIRPVTTAYFIVRPLATPPRLAEPGVALPTPHSSPPLALRI